MHTQSLFDLICTTAESPQNVPFALHLETKMEIEGMREKYGMMEEERGMKNRERTHNTRRTHQAFSDCFISSFYFLHPLLSSLCRVPFSFCISSTSVMFFSLSLSITFCIVVALGSSLHSYNHISGQIQLLLMSLIWNRFF